MGVNLSYKFNDIDTKDSLSVAKTSFELFRIVHGKRKAPDLDKSFGIEKKNDSESSCLFDFIKMTTPFYFEMHNNIANINLAFPESKKEGEEKNEKRDKLYAIINKFKDTLENINELEIPDLKYFKGFYENIQNMKAFSLDQFQEPAIIDQNFL